MTPTPSTDLTAAGLVSDLDALPLSRLHIVILISCCVGFSFDLAEIAFGNILSAVFSAEPHSVPGYQLSWLLASVYIGAALGAPTMGWLADRFGRRTMLFAAMVLLSLVSVLAGFAPDIDSLIITRVFAGISLGAYPPLMFSYLTDILPPRRRGTLVVMATAIGYIGPPAFIFLVRTLTPVSPLGMEAWRWGFIVAAIGAAACAWVFWLMPESPRWLIVKGRYDEARLIIGKFQRSLKIWQSGEPAITSADAAVSAETPSKGYRREAIFLLAIYLLTPWATVGFTVLSGAVLVQKGINVQDSLLFVGISTLGPIFGTLVGGFLADLIQRRLFLVINAVGMGAIGLVFGASDMSLWLVGSALVFNIVLSLFMPILVLYAAEAVSTGNRAKTTSWAWTANRVGSALVPLILLPILHTSGPIAMFAVIAITLIAFIGIVLAFGPPGAAGKAIR